MHSHVVHDTFLADNRYFSGIRAHRKRPRAAPGLAVVVYVYIQIFILFEVGGYFCM